MSTDIVKATPYNQDVDLFDDDDETFAIMEQRVDEINPAVQKMLDSRGEIDAAKLLKGIEKTHEATKKQQRSGANITATIISKSLTDYEGKKNLKYNGWIANVDHCSPVEKDEDGLDVIPVPVEFLVSSGDHDVNIYMHYLSYMERELKATEVPDFLQKYNITLSDVPPFKMGDETKKVFAPEFLKPAGGQSPLMDKEKRNELFLKCEVALKDILARDPSFGYVANTMIQKYKSVPRRGYLYPGGLRDIKGDPTNTLKEGQVVKFMDCYLLVCITYTPFYVDKNKTKQISQQPFKLTYTLKYSDLAELERLDISLLRYAIESSQRPGPLSPPTQEMLDRSKTEDTDATTVVLSRTMNVLKVTPYNPVKLVTAILEKEGCFLSFRHTGFDDGDKGFYATPSNDRGKGENERNDRPSFKKGLYGFQWRKPLVEVNERGCVPTAHVDNIQDHVELLDVDIPIWSGDLDGFEIEKIKHWKEMAPILMKNLSGLILSEMDLEKSFKVNSKNAVLANRKMEALKSKVDKETSIGPKDNQATIDKKRQKRLDYLFLQKEFADLSLVFKCKALLVDYKNCIRSSGIKIDLNGVKTFFNIDKNLKKYMFDNGSTKGEDIILLQEASISLSKLKDDEYDFVVVGDFAITSESKLAPLIEKQYAALYFTEGYNPKNEASMNQHFDDHGVPKDAVVRKVKISTPTFKYVFAVKKDELDKDSVRQMMTTFKRFHGPARQTVRAIAHDSNANNTNKALPHGEETNNNNNNNNAGPHIEETQAPLATQAPREPVVETLTGDDYGDSAFGLTAEELRAVEAAEADMKTVNQDEEGGDANEETQLPEVTQPTKKSKKRELPSSEDERAPKKQKTTHKKTT